MGVWDMLCDNILCPVFEVVSNAVETSLDTIDKAGHNVIDTKFEAIDYAKENPVKSALIAAAAVAGGAVALKASGSVAAYLGKNALLGKAGTGRAISTLSGSALKRASLAKLGGGTKAAGRLGIKGGKALIAATGTATGAVTTKKAITVTNS